MIFNRLSRSLSKCAPRGRPLMSKATVFTALCMAVVVAGCMGDKRRSISAQVFEDPARFVGQSVRMCGYIRDRFEDANIWISRRAEREPQGLGLGFVSDDVSHRPTKWDNRVTCVTGRIERRGCGEGRTICTDSTFAYAIILSKDL